MKWRMLWAKDFGYLMALVIVLATGCSSGPPKSRSLIRQAEKAYSAGEYETVLRNFENVVDSTPYELNRKRYADEIEMYRDSQIKYGLQKAQESEESGHLIEAWVWYIQTSRVDDDREECRKASEDSARVRLVISDSNAQRAALELGNNDANGALVSATRSLYFGRNDQAAEILRTLSPATTEISTFPVFNLASDDTVSDVVRTDSLARLRQSEGYAPYGIPIYFGDVRLYYNSMGTLTVKGVPFSRKLPPGWEKMDALYRLSEKAIDKGADAIINVHYWTKSKKAFTQAELVKFGAF